VRVVQEHEIPRRRRVNERFDWAAIEEARARLGPGEWLEVDGLDRDTRSAFYKTARRREMEVRVVSTGKKGAGGRTLYLGYVR